MTNRTAHDWLPTGRVVSMRPAGEWWDAVSVPRGLALAVLGQLGNQTGAVIEDPRGNTLYWLVEPGGASGWEFNPAASVRVLGETTHIAVPGPQRTTGPQWRVPPTRSRCLTDPQALKTALCAAVQSTFGPRIGAEHFG
ncbi:hypothetical protein ACWGI8_06400 [Streptomyces sp. NPDC054841]